MKVGSCNQTLADAGQIFSVCDSSLVSRRSQTGSSDNPPSGLVRFHISPEESIDARLIARAFGFEPLQYLLIEPDGDRRLRLRQSEHRALEEDLALLRDIGGIDGLVFERINFCPVRPRPLLGSVFLHVCLPFALRQSKSSPAFTQYTRQNSLHTGCTYVNDARS